MNYCGVCLPTIYSHYLNDVEVIRGRNHLWNSLLTQESSEEINKVVGAQLLSVGRRIHRSEVAARVSHFDNYHIRHLCNQWFYDAEPTFTNWGPIESVSSVGSYKYFKINTMSTVTNAHHSLFNWAILLTMRGLASLFSVRAASMNQVRISGGLIWNWQVI